MGLIGTYWDKNYCCDTIAVRLSNLPKPEIMYNVNSFSDPRRAAAEVLRQYWDGSLPVRVDQIAEKMGAQVVRRSPMDFRYSGYFQDANQSPTGRPLIEYNGGDSLNRQRFTLAHELGHFVLRHGTSPRDSWDSFRAGINDPNERAANQFAAEILMPAETVRHVVMRGHASTVEQLASMFGVSTLAMGYRLDNIGMLL